MEVRKAKGHQRKDRNGERKIEFMFSHDNNFYESSKPSEIN